MPSAEEIGALGALLRELGRPASLMSPLLGHADAVARDADRLGLVGPADVDHVVPRHTADSLLFALVRAPQAGERWADVGSGAGFPGLALAICYPETEFVLVEPQRRRAGFLDLQRARLGLENCEIAAARAADLDPGFDVVVARALAEPLIALEAMWRLAVKGGAAIVAVGSHVHTPPGVEEFVVARAGVDSPGRLFMMAEPLGGA